MASQSEASADANDNVTTGAQPGEVRLLFRLFAPQSDSVAELCEALPTIITQTSSGPDSLNYQLHLFLAVIVDKFIASWYLSKLNTDDLEFLQLVYTTLVAIAQDLVTRIQGLTSEPERLVTLSDEVCAILESHISNDDCTHDHEHPILTDRSSYLRTITEKVVSASTAKVPENLSLKSTVIGTRLVNSLVADLVLAKVFDKLTEPPFLLETTGKIASLVKPKAPKKADNSSWRSKITNVLNFVAGLSGTYKNARLEGEKGCNQSFDVLHHRAFSLLATVTNFGSRRPYLYHAIAAGGSLVASVPWVASVINNRVYLAVSKSVASVPEPLLVSETAKVRDILFGNNDGPPKSPTSVAECVEQVMQASASLSTRVYDSGLFLQYANESRSAYEARVTAMVAKMTNQRANTLVIARVFDCLLAYLYPDN
ncbi:hypothetical protein DICA1_B02784 [Diutina catenulata]